MARTAKAPEYATKKELESHKKEVYKIVNKAMKKLQKWDIKQDKNLIKKSKVKQD